MTDPTGYVPAWNFFSIGSCSGDCGAGNGVSWSGGDSGSGGDGSSKSFSGSFNVNAGGGLRGYLFGSVPTIAAIANEVISQNAGPDFSKTGGRDPMGLPSAVHDLFMSGWNSFVGLGELGVKSTLAGNLLVKLGIIADPAKYRGDYDNKIIGTISEFAVPFAVTGKLNAFGNAARLVAAEGAGVARGAGAFESGSFSIADWRGYPSWLPKPAGPFRMLEGAEYTAARDTANQANRAMHAADESLGGWQLHEVLNCI